MSLDDVLDEAVRRRKSVIVYGLDESAFDDVFEGRNVTVEHRRLPQDAPDAFLVVRDQSGFRGAISGTMLEEFFSPPLQMYESIEEVPERQRELVELFEDTVFASMDRRMLLSVTRALENEAWRTRTGTLRVGFQSMEAFRDQLAAYRRLARETDLDVHVYVLPDEGAVDVSEVPFTMHAEPADEIGDHWFLAFDGDGDPDLMFALVAREYEPGSFFGAWSRDPAVIDQVVDAIT